jgi:uncharacterized protein
MTFNNPYPANFLLPASFFLLGFLFLFSACSSPERTETQTEQQERELDFERTVTFLNARGEQITEIEVAVADDDASRTEGLMDVHDLPENAGMLFIFEENEPRSFWMAGTPLSLDIIFINEDYEIVRIHRNTAPYSQESIPSELPAMYVVEVNAGYTMRHDINEGGHIEIGEL